MKIHGQAFLEFVGILLSWNPSLIICRTITGRQSLPVDQGGGKEHKKPLAKTRPPTHTFRQPCSEKDFSDFQWCHVVGHGDVGDGEGWRVGQWWDHRLVQLGGPKIQSYRIELSCKELVDLNFLPREVMPAPKETIPRKHIPRVL